MSFSELTLVVLTFEEGAVSTHTHTRLVFMWLRVSVSVCVCTLHNNYYYVCHTYVEPLRGHNQKHNGLCFPKCVCVCARACAERMQFQGAVKTPVE